MSKDTRKPRSKNVSGKAAGEYHDAVRRDVLMRLGLSAAIATPVMLGLMASKAAAAVVSSGTIT